MATETGAALEPWGIKPSPLPLRAALALGAGSLIASFYIGTGDVAVATSMGAQFGFQLLWTYLLLSVAGFALIDMSVRYFLVTGKTPVSIFKDLHPVLSLYLFATVVVTGIFGSFSQWNACALVLTGLFPGLPVELSGGLSALVALVFLWTGFYRRVERAFVAALILLVGCFFASGLLVGVPWGEAVRGLVPRSPQGRWFPLFMANAGSMLNAWLILIYPYTMMEKGWRPKELRAQVDLLHRVRLDYAWGILAAALVALPIMGTAAAVLRPFGILPRSYMDFGVLLEPLAGPASTWLFLAGLFVAAWTSGVGWWMSSTYAVLDFYRLPLRIDSRAARKCLVLFFVPSAAMLAIRLNPIYQILIFAAFLASAFPILALALAWRLWKRDIGYFRWTLKNSRGTVVVLLDLFAIGLSVYVGWTNLGEVLGFQR
ncbi:MAG: divalent metal cation transporter [Acidobacteria bacterium]|nr:divalent metal cation transporter [Acidobacteriota bacterium]